jgi:LPS-assembly protein
MRRFGSALLIVSALALGSPLASAQPPAGLPPLSAQPPAPAPSPASGSTSETVSADRRELTSDQKNAHYIGHVEIERPDVKIYADDVVMQGDANRMILTGNVVLAQGNNRLSAERAEFDTKSGLGTFYNAWGIASVQPPRQAPRPGVSVPTQSGQETNVYFFGDKIEKVGPKKYKITNGGFSTCVQPTPRWDLHADTVILNVDHYTVLKQAVFTVKGVPMLYVPILYYPTKREQRATGFLLPTYGSSARLGQSLHNAFFWAINRSQDATLMHDWYSKGGQGYGSEYRYNFGGGSDGNFVAHLQNMNELTDVGSDGISRTTPAERTFDLRGGANQMLPGNLRARANIDYWSDVQARQAYTTNIIDYSNNRRAYGANIVGAWGTYSMNATLDHSEYFYGANTSALSGSWPRITFTRMERPLLGSDLYFTLNTDVGHLLRESRQPDATGEVIDTDSSVGRFDISPQIRYPFKKWQWFTVNSTAGFRDTYYTRSYAPTDDPNVRVPIDEPLNRELFVVSSQIVGPVFNRIFDTPGNGFAERFKHTIEPTVVTQYTTNVPEVDRILDNTDYIAGGTNITYGITNRFFAKRKIVPNAPAQAREFANVELSQTYYTNQKQSQFDPRNSASFGAAPSHFSALRLRITAIPTNDVNANFSAEFDSRTRALIGVTATGIYSWTSRLQTNVSWTKHAAVQQIAGVEATAITDQYVNATTNVHTRDNRVGGIYSFNYDLLHSSLLQQRMSAFYSAQCCGVAFEYQTYSGGGLFNAPGDHRFFLSFTLAGLGNFSPFNGALSGVPR